MPLAFSASHASDPGPRPKNDDFCGMTTPQGAELDSRGAVFALADGVSGEAAGREAAEYTVRGLLADFYATPETWETPQALNKILQAGNRWLLSRSVSRPELAGMATTLSALVLRRRRYVLAHVGDSRIYRLRDGKLEQLTTDHVWEHPDLRHVLRRAVGLDQQLAVDFAEGDLVAGDVFVLVSDGVWEPLAEAGLIAVLRSEADPEKAAPALIAAALAAGGQDNASAVVVRIDALPDESLPESLVAARSLRVPPRLKPGQTLDGYLIRDVIHASRQTLLYRAEAPATGQMVVIKTLTPEAADDETGAALLAEEWMAKRVISHYLPQVLPCPERSALYYAMSWHEGATLQQKIDAGWHFSVADVVQIGIRLLKGLAALHNRNLVHCDIKPANLHAGADGRLRILDLGVALNPGGMHERAGKAGAGNPGTPSFMAPELFGDATPTAGSDLYAAGVTLYYLLTRHYPYGEIEPFQYPRFGEPAAPTRYRPEIPEWLENVLLKACAKNPEERFETAEEFLLALENAARRPLERPRKTPLIARTRALARWKVIAVGSLLFNVVLLVLLLGR